MACKLGKSQNKIINLLSTKDSKTRTDKIERKKETNKKKTKKKQKQEEEVTGGKKIHSYKTKWTTDIQCVWCRFWATLLGVVPVLYPAKKKSSFFSCVWYMTQFQYLNKW